MGNHSKKMAKHQTRCFHSSAWHVHVGRELDDIEYIHFLRQIHTLGRIGQEFRGSPS